MPDVPQAQLHCVKRSVRLEFDEFLVKTSQISRKWSARPLPQGQTQSMPTAYGRHSVFHQKVVLIHIHGDRGINVRKGGTDDGYAVTEYLESRVRGVLDRSPELLDVGDARFSGISPEKPSSKELMSCGFAR